MAALGGLDRIDREDAQRIGEMATVARLMLKPQQIRWTSVVSIMEVLEQGLGDAKYAPHPLLRELVAAGSLGRKSGRGFFEHG